MAEIEEILNFWLIECKPEQWFKKNEDFDRMIEKRFSGTIKDAGTTDNATITNSSAIGTAAGSITVSA